MMSEIGKWDVISSWNQLSRKRELEHYCKVVEHYQLSFDTRIWFSGGMDNFHHYHC